MNPVAHSTCSYGPTNFKYFNLHLVLPLHMCTPKSIYMVLNNNEPVIFTTLLNYYLSSTSFILYDNHNDNRKWRVCEKTTVFNRQLNRVRPRI